MAATLVIGFGNRTRFSASDGPLLVGRPDRIVYLADHELGVITQLPIRMVYFDKGHVRHNVNQLDMDASQVEVVDDVIRVHAILEFLQPVCDTDPFQHLEYHAAILRGCGRQAAESGRERERGVNNAPNQVSQSLPHVSLMLFESMPRAVGNSIVRRIDTDARNLLLPR